MHCKGNGQVAESCGCGNCVRAVGAADGGMGAEARARAGQARDGKEGGRAVFVASGSQGRLGEEDSSSKQIGGRLVAAMNRPLHTIWKPVRSCTWIPSNRNPKSSSASTLGW